MLSFSAYLMFMLNTIAQFNEFFRTVLGIYSDIHATQNKPYLVEFVRQKYDFYCITISPYLTRHKLVIDNKPD